jgi:hypothetical protein
MCPTRIKKSHHPQLFLHHTLSTWAYGTPPERGVRDYAGAINMSLLQSEEGGNFLETF